MGRVKLVVAAWWPIAVRRAMAARNKSQKQLAEAIGAHQSQVCEALYRNHMQPSVIFRISDYLGVPRPVFFPETEADARTIEIITSNSTEES